MIKLISKRLSLAIATLALGAAMHAAPVAAATYNVGDLPQPTPYTQVVNHVGSFMDTFNFDLTTASGVTGAFVSLDLAFGNLNVLHISNPVIALYSVMDNINPLALSATSFSFNNLAAGSYYVNITGIGDGIGGGSYLFGLSAMPAPEPEQWMLFAAGLLAIGGIVRRRSV